MARRAQPKIQNRAGQASGAAAQLHAIRMRALPSEWAMENRKIPNTFTGQVEPWNFKYREWQRDILDDKSSRIVVEKAAQMGLTEVAMNRALHALDALNRPVLYLFPTLADSGDFSQSRFDPMLQMSPRLDSMFTDVSNVSLKRAGAVSMYFRGSNSSSGLKSIPVGYLVIDEFEEMVEASVALARKRLIGHAENGEFNLSTPRFPGAGIDAEFQETDQRHWYVPCPHCGESQALRFEANLVIPDATHIGATWRCGMCEKPWTEQERLDLLDLGEWRDHNPGALKRGYHISQLYSPVSTAERIGEAWHEGQRSATLLQEFYNSFLGLPHEAKGIKLTAQLMQDCTGSVPMESAVTDTDVYTAMGADIGLRNHYQIGVVTNGVRRVIAVGETDWNGLSMLMELFNVDVCVVDAAPERHSAHAFRDAFQGRVWLAFYPNTEGLSGVEVRWKDDAETVDIHRTAVADRYVKRISDREIVFPGDLPREFVRHHVAVYRTLEPTTTGAERAVWRHRGPDHFFHAGVYLDTALERLFENSEGDIDFGSGADGAWGDSAANEPMQGIQFMEWPT